MVSLSKVSKFLVSKLLSAKLQRKHRECPGPQQHENRTNDKKALSFSIEKRMLTVCLGLVLFKYCHYINLLRRITLDTPREVNPLNSLQNSRSCRLENVCEIRTRFLLAISCYYLTDV